MKKEQSVKYQAVWRIRGEVTVRISVRPLTVANSPNCVQSNPNFAKPSGH